MHSHLDIQVEGNSANLRPDTQAQFTDQNPLFNEVEMFSLPIDLPAALNRHLFMNFDARDSMLRAQDVENKTSKVIVEGLPFRTTVLHVQEEQVLSDSIPVNFDSRTKTFKDMISNLKCREIPVDDDILIGEKLGTVYFSFEYGLYGKLRTEVNVGEGSDTETKYWYYDLTDSTSSMSQEFNPPALGFSWPAKVDVSDYKEKTYDGATVKVPKVLESYINVAAPYPSAKYCNSSICYVHYGKDENGTTKDPVPADKANWSIEEDRSPYWVLPADRAASGICFYVAYFLERLFKHLGVLYDMTALTNIEDFNYLAFFTTTCKYDEEQLPSTLVNIKKINDWLDNHGAGGQVAFETDSLSQAPKTIDGSMTRAEFEAYNPEWSSFTTHTTFLAVKSYTAHANRARMYANSENFPDATVTEVIESLENSFGAKFLYDIESNKVTVVLLRDVFRSKEAPIHLNGTVLSFEKMTEKITGFRMKYSSESDKDEQRENVRTGKRDYDTDYDYMDYPAKRVVFKNFVDVAKKVDMNDMSVYVDLRTGNVFRVKVDADATSAKEMKPVGFEVGQFKGVEIGDCSKENEDNIVEMVSDFQPIVVNDVEFRNPEKGITSAGYQPRLVPFIDDDMEHEFIETKIQNAFLVEGKEIYFTYKLKLRESYDPSNTDDGNSPLMTHDWGLAVAILRTGDGGAGVENFDPNYDGFGNWKWRDIADNYCVASDTLAHNGQWLGKTDPANAFSLKIRAFKAFRYKPDPDNEGKYLISTDPKQWEQEEGWLIPCDNDERDPQTGMITKRIRSRGLFDTFMSEFAHFLLNRQKYSVKMLCTAAQLADIPNNWLRRYEIDNRIGYLNKVSYDVSAETGIGEVTIEFFVI